MKQSGRTSVAASSSNSNILSGTPFEFVPVLSELHFGFFGGDNAAITTGDIEVDVIVGGETLVLSDIVTALGAVGRMPVFPDDFHLTGHGAAGDRMIIRMRNLDAAQPAILYWVIMINPI